VPDETDIKSEMPWPESLAFRDNKGRVIHLRDNLTIGELAVMGIKVGLAPREAPIKEGEFIHVPA